MPNEQTAFTALTSASPNARHERLNAILRLAGTAVFAVNTASLLVFGIINSLLILKMHMPIWLMIGPSIGLLNSPIFLVIDLIRLQAEARPPAP